MTVRVYPLAAIRSPLGGAVNFNANAANLYTSDSNAVLFTSQRGQGNPATTDFHRMDISVANARMEFSRFGGVGNAASITRYIPTVLVNAALRGAAQFAEGRLVAESALAGIFVGPAVLIQGDPVFDQGVLPNGGNGYVIAHSTAGALPRALQLRRASITASVLATSATLINAGDTVRIEVRPSGANWSVQVFLNGAEVLDLAVLDNNINRPRAGEGYPGVHVGNIPIPAATFSAWDSQIWGRL